MAAPAFLDLIVRLKDQASAGLTTLSKNVKKNQSDIASMTKMAGVAFVGLSATLGVAVKKYADLEQAITNAATVTGRSGKEFEDAREKMEDIARTLGRETKFSAINVANAFYTLASAGRDVANMSKDELKPFLDLSAATLYDLGETTKIVNSIMNQFELEQNEAGRVADVFAKAIGSSQATMEKLGVSFQYVGPMAAAMGMSIEETTAILSKLYDSGINASTAATSLRMIMSQLMMQTGKTKEVIDDMVLSQLGVKEQFETSDLSLKKFLEANKELGAQFSKLKDKLSKELNPSVADFDQLLGKLSEQGVDTQKALELVGVRGGGSLLTLIKTKDGVKKLTEALTDIGGTAEEMAKKQLNTLSGSALMLLSSLDELMFSVIKPLIPAIRGVVDILTMLVNWFSMLPKPILEVISVLAAVAVATTGLATVIGVVALVIPTLVAGFVFLKGAVVAATIAYSAFIIAHTALLAAFAVVALGVGLLVYKYLEMKAAADAARVSMEKQIELNKQLSNSFNKLGETMGGAFKEVAEGRERIKNLQNEILVLTQKEIDIQSSLGNAILGLGQDEIKSIQDRKDAIQDKIDTELKLTKERQDKIGASEGEIFRNFQQLQALRSQLDKETFQAQVKIIKDRGGVADELNKKILAGEIQLTQDQLRIIQKFGIANTKIIGAIAKVDTKVAIARLKMAKTAGIKREGLIQSLIDFNAGASKKEVEIFTDGLKRKQEVLNTFESNVMKLVKPKILKIGIALEDLTEGGVFGFANKTLDFLRDPNTLVNPMLETLSSGFSELNTQVDSELGAIDADIEAALGEIDNYTGDIMSDIGDTVGSASKDMEQALDDLKQKSQEATDEINSLHDKHYQKLKGVKDEVTKVSEEYAKSRTEIVENIAQIQTQLDKLGGKESEIAATRDQAFAKQIVKQKELTQNIEEQISKQEEALAKVKGREKDEDTASRIKEEEEKLQSLKDRLAKEQIALKDQAGLRERLAEEIAEIEEFNQLTAFEQAMERAEQEYQRGQERIEADRLLLEEKLINLEEHLKNEQVAFEGHMKELQNQRDKEILGFTTYLELRMLAWKRHINQMKTEAARNDIPVTQAAASLPFEAAPQFAQGGVVSKPTFGLMGESGPEAVIPLAGGKIPVEMRGKAQPTNININFGDVSVRNEADIDSLANKVGQTLARMLDLNRQGLAT